MTLAYGYVKTKVTSEPKLKSSHHGHETQYHLHCNLAVDGGTWDVAVNVAVVVPACHVLHSTSAPAWLGSLLVPLSSGSPTVLRRLVL